MQSFEVVIGRLSLHTSQAAHQAGAYPGFHGMKRLRVLLLPLGWDASPSQGYPQYFAGTHLYTRVERGNVRVKCLAQEHNTMSPARTRTRTIRSGVEDTNHEATAPPTKKHLFIFKIYFRRFEALLGGRQRT